MIDWGKLLDSAIEAGIILVIVILTGLFVLVIVFIGMATNDWVMYSIYFIIFAILTKVIYERKQDK